MNFITLYYSIIEIILACPHDLECNTKTFRPHIVNYLKVIKNNTL